MSRKLFPRWLRPIRRPAAPLCRLQLVALEARDVPATFTVNSTLDAAPVADGVLTLREAMTALNTGNGNALSAAEKALVTGTYGTNDTVNLAGVSGAITMIAELNGIKSMTIAGPGADKLTLNANAKGRVFTLTTGGTVTTISGLTLTGGTATAGGAILTDSGATLTVADAVIAGNSAAIDGGGIASVSLASGDLTILRTTVANNTAGGGGSGGGIWTRTNILIDASTLSGNTNNGGAFGGGGIVITGADRVRTIRNSTLAGNVSKAQGGAIALEGAVGTLTVQNSTITANTVTTSANGGGGISRVGGTASIRAANVSGSARASRIILAAAGLVVAVQPRIDELLEDLVIDILQFERHGAAERVASLPRRVPHQRAVEPRRPRRRGDGGLRVVAAEFALQPDDRLHRRVLDVLPAVMAEPAAVQRRVLAHQPAQIADGDVEVPCGDGPVVPFGPVLGDLLDKVVDVVGSGVVPRLVRRGSLETVHGVLPSR